MRFLFFNFVVGGALFYLIFGNPGDVARDTGFSEATASVIENLRQKARKTQTRVDSGVENKLWFVFVRVVCRLYADSYLLPKYTQNSWYRGPNKRRGI